MGTSQDIDDDDDDDEDSNDDADHNHDKSNIDIDDDDDGDDDNGDDDDDDDDNNKGAAGVLARQNFIFDLSNKLLSLCVVSLEMVVRYIDGAHAQHGTRQKTDYTAIRLKLR